MSVDDARARAIATLTEAFTKDVLEIDQLEDRLGKVHNAEAEAEINALVADLAPPTQAIAVRQVTLAPSEVQETQKMSAIFSSLERRGTWSGARHMTASALFGSVVLDFREARLPGGVFDLDVSSVFGSIEIIVPPDLAVEANGSGIFGSFEVLDRSPAHPDPNRPLLRISGNVVFASVEVKTLLLGETGSEAWARKRELRREVRRQARIERRARRRLARGGD